MTHMAAPFRTLLFAALALSAIAPLASAQQRVPLREGNIWGGLDHEPVPSDVHRSEEAAGIAQSPTQEDRSSNEVETLYRQLIQKEGGR